MLRDLPRRLASASWLQGPLLLAAVVAAVSTGCGGTCSEGEARCSDDALTLEACVDGAWQTTACMADHGQLCEAGACVDPWTYGAPAWSLCQDEPRATPESLHDKMVYYEERGRALHLNPHLGWITPVTLPCLEVTCGPGETPPCLDCDTPAVDPDTATWEDVETFHTGENDGLWSALYLAAEAFRYGVTGDPEALEVMEVLLAGEVDRMRITGVAGLFTRQYIPPEIPGIACPDDLTRYMPDEEKDDNQWVRINADGCVETVDPETSEWVASSHCGLDDYVGYCWLDNVSKDEYAGHMFALGAVLKLVDDADLQETTRDLLGQVGRHLVENRLVLVDWDGRVTEHGRFYARSMIDWPSFNAAMALSYLKLAAAATDDPEIIDWYEGCLLQVDGPRDCVQRPPETPRVYLDYLPESSLYIGAESCGSNWNNFSMHLLSLHHLIWFETNPEWRAAVQRHFEDDLFAPSDTLRPLAEQHNSFFNFAFAAHKALGPASTGPALDAVADGLCMLRQFPSTKEIREVLCPPEDFPRDTCTNRFGDDMLVEPREVADRCVRQFLWWGDPYSVGECAANPRRIEPPTDYLLAYWMGRYYGFIPEDL